jgi:hypothetical protein
MVASRSIKGQLHRAGHKFRIFGRSECKELSNILEPHETIVKCAYGYYHGGSGILVATDKRLILVDKRPLYLNVESMRYKNIKDVEFDTKMLQGILYLDIGVKRLVFRSISDASLRKIKEYVYARIQANEEPNVQFAPHVAQRSARTYLNPAWRPHHLTAMPRSKYNKYHKSM